MYGYENAALASSQSPVGAVPALGQLKQASERIAMTAEGVAKFLYRFNGPLPENGQAADAPTPDSYRNDIETLFEQVARLERLVSMLEGIG